MVDHWESHARQWAHIGPPLRPTTSDVRYVENAVSSIKGSPHLNATLLGVTPELAGLRWPPHTMLLGVDRNPAMLRFVWPGKDIAVRSHCVRGEWSALPLRQGSMNAVVGDGCFTLLVGTESYRSVSGEIRRVLEPEGQFIMRFFTRPAKHESTGVVLDDLRRGRVANFHVFKWRLAMALPQSFETGVAVADIWEAWHDAEIDSRLLARDRGWSVESIETIQAYRGSSARYSFPTWGELQEVLSDFFEVSSTHIGDYELAERCPTIVYVAKT